MRIRPGATLFPIILLLRNPDGSAKSSNGMHSLLRRIVRATPPLVILSSFAVQNVGGARGDISPKFTLTIYPVPNGYLFAYINIDDIRQGGRLSHILTTIFYREGLKMADLSKSSVAALEAEIQRRKSESRQKLRDMVAAASALIESAGVTGVRDALEPVFETHGYAFRYKGVPHEKAAALCKKHCNEYEDSTALFDQQTVIDIAREAGCETADVWATLRDEERFSPVRDPDQRGRTTDFKPVAKKKTR